VARIGHIAAQYVDTARLDLARLGIHPGQDLTSLDNITVLDQDLCDAPRCFGGNVDLRGFDTPIADRKAVRKASRLELAPGEGAAPCEAGRHHTRC
jgi:hypothetical protein